MVTIAAVVLCLLLGALAVFQVLLAFGAPFGRFAWGGQHRVLPMAMRIGSVTSIVIYAVVAVVPPRPLPRLRRGVHRLGYPLGAQSCASTRTVDAGWRMRASGGRIGREVNPPPQLGHTPCRFVSTQSRQKVHSKVQIIAS